MIFCVPPLSIPQIKVYRTVSYRNLTAWVRKSTNQASCSYTQMARFEVDVYCVLSFAQKLDQVDALLLEEVRFAYILFESWIISGMSKNPQKIRILDVASGIPDQRKKEWILTTVLSYVAQEDGRNTYGSGSGFNQVSESGSRRVKMTHKSRKNQEISCFEVLDVLF
jgi:hypothetical protein